MHEQMIAWLHMCMGLGLFGIFIHTHGFNGPGWEASKLVCLMWY